MKKLLAFSIFFGMSCIAQANLVTNGSFELPYRAVPNNPFSGGSTAIAGWTVIGGRTAISITNVLGTGFLNGTPLHFPASDGQQWANLAYAGGWGEGLYSDVMPVALGATYRISFDIGDRGPAAGDGGNNSVGLSINGGPLETFTNFDNPGQTETMSWESFDKEWIADTTHLQVTFLGIRPSTGRVNNTLGLDNISVNLSAIAQPPNSVPEPNSMILLIVGLAGFLSTLRKEGLRKLHRGVPIGVHA